MYVVYYNINICYKLNKFANMYKYIDSSISIVLARPVAYL